MSQIKFEPSETFESQDQQSSSKTQKITKLPISSTLPSDDSLDPTKVESRIIELCKQQPEGISDPALQNAMFNITKEQRLAALNRLLSLGKIDLVKSSQSGLLYRLKDTDEFLAAKDSDVDETLVYTIIKEAGNKGIWIRDISYKTNLKATVCNKVLKSLESKKLIKSVTSVNASKKKVYMLYDLEPDRSLTGGAWYSGKEFESEFVDILNEQCYIYLCEKKASSKGTDPLMKRNASYATSKEIREYIKNLGISKVELSIDDIESILNTLVFDGKVERSIINSNNMSKNTNNEQISLYRAINQLLTIENGFCGSGYVRVPCGICPVIDDCHENGPISPASCVYMKEWLEF